MGKKKEMILFQGPTAFYASQEIDHRTGAIIRQIFRWQFITFGPALKRRILTFDTSTRQFSSTTRADEAHEQTPHARRILASIYLPNAIQGSYLKGKTIKDKMVAMLPDEEIAHITAMSIQHTGTRR